MPDVILASASPRRKELLSSLGLEYSVCPADIDETAPDNISSSELSEYLAVKKAKSVLSENMDSVVIGSDTTVVIGDIVLGKPENKEDAKRMLEMLSGNKHTVYTGLCVCSKDKTVSLTNATDVYFHNLSTETIDAYVETGDPLDKAGAYGIQGIGSVLVKKIDGDFFSVMGLPVADTAIILKKFGIRTNII